MSTEVELEQFFRKFSPLTREKAINFSANKYFNGDNVIAEIFLEKYIPEFFINRDAVAEYREKNINNFFKNIAEEIFSMEKNFKDGLSYERILELINGFKKGVLGGSVMAGLIKSRFISLGNCFVVGTFHDSYNSILQTEAHMVNILKRRGGVGTDLSHLRPKGSLINNAALESTGIVPFAERYSNAIMEVSQAKGRRGAGMLTLDISHPDAHDFVAAKRNENKLNGVNISLKIDDNYMNFLAKESQFKGKILYPRNIEKIFNFSINNMTEYAEPGFLFWDRINEQIDSVIYKKEGMAPVSTNPCSEIPLPAYDSCRLASINVYEYINNPFTKYAEFDIDRFYKDVYDFQKIMDSVVSLEIRRIKDILTKLEEERSYTHTFGVLDDEINMWNKVMLIAKNGRRTGLGLMGIADAAAALGYVYGDNNFMLFTESLSNTFALASYSSTIDMAKNRGSFPVYKNTEFNKRANVPFLDNIISLFKKEAPEYIEKWNKYGRRNIQTMAIAPTGTISMLAQVSSGIEPVYMIRYKRRRRASEGDEFSFQDENGYKWKEFNVVHKPFKDWAIINGYNNIESLSDEEFNSLVKESPYNGATAYEIDPMKKIIMQGQFQRNIDHSISITHNLPKGTSSNEVKRLSIFAWQQRVKGFTVYVDGSRMGVLVGKDAEKKENNKISAIKRPKTLKADVYNTSVRGKNFVVIVGKIDNSPYEVFAYKSNEKVKISSGFITKIKGGVYDLLDENKNVIIEDVASKFETPEEEFGTRLISTSLRHGADIKFIYEQLMKSNGDITHFSKAIGRVLRKYVVNSKIDKLNECPNCGSSDIKMVDGCVSCLVCGWSKCN